MDKFNKTMVFCLICLSVSLGWMGYVAAIPATNRNSIVTPGSMTKPCSYDIFLDGSNYQAQNCHTGDNDSAPSSDAAVVINSAITALASTGGIIHLENAIYSISSQILPTASNVFIEGEGGTADNAASYPNAAYTGTIIFATNSFPTGASLAAPKYMILVGGNGLIQMQGGGISRVTLANA